MCSVEKRNESPVHRSLSPSLYVLSPIINVHRFPLQILSISACFNIIIPGDFGERVIIRGHKEGLLFKDGVNLRQE